MLNFGRKIKSQVEYYSGPAYCNTEYSGPAYSGTKYSGSDFTKYSTKSSMDTSFAFSKSSSIPVLRKRRCSVVGRGDDDCQKIPSIQISFAGDSEIVDPFHVTDLTSAEILESDSYDGLPESLKYESDKTRDKKCKSRSLDHDDDDEFQGIKKKGKHEQEHFTDFKSGLDQPTMQKADTENAQSNLKNTTEIDQSNSDIHELQDSQVLENQYPNLEPKSSCFEFPSVDQYHSGHIDQETSSLDAHELETEKIDEPKSPGMNLSFAGCGFLGIYHVGVSACLRKYAPELLVERIAGASAGALAAALLLCDADLGVITSSVLKTATEARARALGPFSPTFDVEKLLREGLLKVLPANAHEIVSGRLFVSVTRISDGKNVMLSQFNTREELVQTLLCSAFIPGFSGYRPLKIHGIRYMDGGFTDNLPQLDDGTVTVSPFCGEADVCPTDNTPGLITVSLANTSIEISRENLQRFGRILFPPPPETLNKMCQQGFNDALDFLQRNNLIACTRCVAVQSTVPLSAHQDDEDVESKGGGNGTAAARRALATAQSAAAAAASSAMHGGMMGGVAQPFGAENFYCDDEEYEEWEEEHCVDCPDCWQQRQDAIIDELPDTVTAILEEAIATANAEVSRWFSLSSTMKVISILTLPAAYSVKLPFKFFKGLGSILPSAPSSDGIRVFLSQLTELVRTVLLSRRQAAVTEMQPAADGGSSSTGHHRHHHRKRDSSFSCNVAITEFSGSAERRGSMARPHSLELPTDWHAMYSDAPDSDSDTENEALNRLALQYARRSSRSASLIPGCSVALSRSASRATSRVPSRAVSRAVSRRASVSTAGGSHGSEDGWMAEEDVNYGTPDLFLQQDAAGTTGQLTHHPDAFDKIINVTNEHEALMAYYYLDENNQMQVTEIFDMSAATGGNDDDDDDDDEDDDYSDYYRHQQQQQQQQYLNVPYQQQQQQQPKRRLSSILRNGSNYSNNNNSSSNSSSDAVCSYEQQQQEYILNQLTEFRDRHGSNTDDEDDEDGVDKNSVDDDVVVDDAEMTTLPVKGRRSDSETASEASQASSRSPSEPEADQHLEE